MWKLSLVMLVGCGEIAPELEFQLTVHTIDERATTAVFLDEPFPITNASRRHHANVSVVRVRDRGSAIYQ